MGTDQLFARNLTDDRLWHRHSRGHDVLRILLWAIPVRKGVQEPSSLRPEPRRGRIPGNRQSRRLLAEVGFLLIQPGFARQSVL
jgi:hypothetical protein